MNKADLAKYENFFETAGLIGVDIGQGPMRFYIAKDLFMNDMNELSTMKAQIVAAKETAAELSAVVVERHKVIDEMIALMEERFRNDNAEAILNAEFAATLARDLETELRKAITREYERRRADAKASGDDPDKVSKQLGDGLSVRVAGGFSYPMDRAVTWASEHAPFMVVRTVDAKQFESAIKSLDELPPFVTREEKITPVVSFGKSGKEMEIPF